MAQLQSQSISQEKFLLMCVNLLHKVFFEAPRTDAKKAYRQLEEGNTILLTTVQMEDKSTVRFHLALDCSEFRGKLTSGPAQSERIPEDAPVNIHPVAVAELLQKVRNQRVARVDIEKLVRIDPEHPITIF